MIVPPYFPDRRRSAAEARRAERLQRLFGLILHRLDDGLGRRHRYMASDEFGTAWTTESASEMDAVLRDEAAAERAKRERERRACMSAHEKLDDDIRRDRRREARASPPRTWELWRRGW